MSSSRVCKSTYVLPRTCAWCISLRCHRKILREEHAQKSTSASAAQINQIAKCRCGKLYPPKECTCNKSSKASSFILLSFTNPSIGEAGNDVPASCERRYHFVHEAAQVVDGRPGDRILSHHDGCAEISAAIHQILAHEGGRAEGPALCVCTPTRRF